jgi:hypothetical protein
VNFQAGMQQPGILQPAEADSPSIGRRRLFNFHRRLACWTCMKHFMKVGYLFSG